METRPLFEPNAMYHLYNQGHGGENLFKNKGNYNYFLEKYQKYIYPIARTYAYCLMPNHFHFFLHIRPIEELLVFYNSKHKKNLSLSDFEHFDEKVLSKIISQELSNMLNGYTQAINKEQKRRGGLFQHRTRRKKIMDEQYRNQLIVYIHRNPIHHGYVNDFSEWKSSSYNRYFSGKHPIQIEKNTTIDWFGNLSIFKEKHQSNLEHFLLAEYDY